jgi:hypothetical protein
LNAIIAATAITVYVFYVWNWILPRRQRAPALMWIVVGGSLAATWAFYFWLRRSKRQ